MYCWRDVYCLLKDIHECQRQKTQHKTNEDYKHQIRQAAIISFTSSASIITFHSEIHSVVHNFIVLWIQGSGFSLPVNSEFQATFAHIVVDCGVADGYDAHRQEETDEEDHLLR